MLPCSKGGMWALMQQQLHEHMYSCKEVGCMVQILKTLENLW